MQIELHEDGSWDLKGRRFALKGCLPYVNGTPYPWEFLHKKDDQLSYEGCLGTLTLSFSAEKERIRISCQVQGGQSIHDISPLGGRLLAPSGTREPLKAFVQGFGMEGPSGIHALEGEGLLSNGLIAIRSGQDGLLAYAVDHRHFVNRYRLEERGGLFTEKALFLEGGFNLESTRRGDFALPDIFLREWEGSLADELENCARKISGFMGTRMGQKEPAFHWCSWYYHYQNMSQDILEDYAPRFAREEPSFRFLQIDEGYCPSLGDWLLPNHLYPEGLAKAARTILEAGYQPGIWMGPFMVGDQSSLYQEHPDWVVKDLDGKPVVKICSYNEPKAFGLPDGEFYVLDATHPGALAYLKEVFETLKAWGFKLFKTDFILWNMLDTSRVQRHDASLTSVEILRRVLDVIREAIGEDSYLLGCIAPFLPFLGYADGMRIAGDVGAQWEGAYGPKNLLQEISADNYFQHIYWQNDPDSILLREREIFLKPREIESLALLQALSGGVVTTSEAVHLLPEDRRDLLAMARPDGSFHKPRFPYLEADRQEMVLVQDLKQGNLVYVLNPTDGPLTVALDLTELTGRESAFIRRFRGEAPDQPVSQYVKRLDAHESALLFVTDKRLTREPKNLWDWSL